MIDELGQNIWLAFGLTLLAGLATGVGSALAFFTRHTYTKFLSLTLGFSAGVMIYVSFVEIFAKAEELFSATFGPSQGRIFTVLAFFAGIALTALIDRLIPPLGNPHEMYHLENLEEERRKHRDPHLFRMGIFAAIAITIHNFPEGLATFTAALSDPSLGIAIAIAIAIHNIPEGIAVSVPIYYATGNHRRAFGLSFLSGLAEPVGAVVGYLFLMPLLSEHPYLLGLVFGLVAGIMVFISLDELLPTAEEYGEHHLAIYGLISGMVVMAGSLLILM